LPERGEPLIAGETAQHRSEGQMQVRDMQRDYAARGKPRQVERQRFAGEEMDWDRVGAERVQDDDAELL